MGGDERRMVGHGIGAAADQVMHATQVLADERFGGCRVPSVVEPHGGGAAEERVRREREEKDRAEREAQLRLQESERRAQIEASTRLEQARIEAEARARATAAGYRGALKRDEDVLDTWYSSALVP